MEKLHLNFICIVFYALEEFYFWDFDENISPIWCFFFLANFNFFQNSKEGTQTYTPENSPVIIGFFSNSVAFDSNILIPKSCAMFKNQLKNSKYKLISV